MNSRRSLGEKRFYSDDDEGSSPKAPKLGTVQLNLDTLLHIFQYLNCRKSLINAAKVCHTWRLAAYESSLWRGCELDLSNSCLSEQTAISLRHRKIKVVKLKNEHISSSLMRLLSETMEVEVMAVKHTATTENLLKYFPSKFDSLRCLSLIHPRSSTTLTSSSLERLLAPLMNLEHFHVEIDMEKASYFRKAKSLEFNYFQLVFSCLPNLKDLEIAMYHHCDGFDFSYMQPDEQYPKLERLVLHEVCADLGPLTDVISKRFPNLKHFSVQLWNYSHFVDEVNFYHGLKHLESLRANSSFYMQWVIYELQHVCKTSRNLTALDISLDVDSIEYYHDAEHFYHLGDEDVELIFATLPKLKMLNIYGQYVNLLPFNRMALHMRNMEVLVLGSERTNFENENADRAEFFINLKENWTKLRSLLGVRLDYESCAHLGNVCYVSNDDRHEWNDDVCRIELHVDSEPKLKPIDRDTPEWHTAVGTSLFQLPSSYTFGFEQLYNGFQDSYAGCSAVKESIGV